MVDIDKLEKLIQESNAGNGVSFGEFIKEACSQAQPMIDEIRRLRELTEWQDIGTAPKDGVCIDLWCNFPGNGHSDSSPQFRLTDCWFCPDQNTWLTVGTDGELENIIKHGAEPCFWKPILNPKGYKEESD